MIVFKVYFFYINKSYTFYTSLLLFDILLWFPAHTIPWTIFFFSQCLSKVLPSKFTVGWLILDGDHLIEGDGISLIDTINFTEALLRH